MGISSFYNGIFFCTNPDALPLILLMFLGTLTYSVPEPHERVPEQLRRGYHVERGRNGTAVLEIGHPQFGAGILPFRV